mgnify:CR=1 FL=1
MSWMWKRLGALAYWARVVCLLRLQTCFKGVKVMARYSRGQIEKFVIRTKRLDLAKFTDEALADSLALVRKMKASLDKEKETVRKSLKVVK